MNKAIIFDVDGTAKTISSETLPSERLKNVIAKLRNRYHISTATGRSKKNAHGIIEFLELVDPCIIAAGTEIYDPVSKEIIWREPIPTAAYPHIIEALKGNKNRASSGYIHTDSNHGDSVSNLLDETTTVIYILEVDEDVATALTERLLHPELTIINMHAFIDQSKRDLHIHSSKASKEHAVAALLDMLKLNKDDSIVVGDGLNDLHLFAAGGTKVAMGNAVPELKKAADIVIRSIDEDGLAEYFESLTSTD